MSGVTVITHGFNTSGSIFDWTVSLGQAILDRADGPLTDRSVGSLYRHDPETGQWQPFADDVWTNNNSPDDQIVLIYDWADDSALFQDGWLEAAADNLFASLQIPNDNLGGQINGRSFTDAACATPACDELDFHFIGHSRGAVLNSLVTERFDAYLPNRTIDQVTSLDPHPASLMNDPGYVSNNPNENSRLFTYDNVVFADNYYRQDFLYELDGDFNGVFAEGAYNLRIPESVLSGAGSSFEHSDVHTWYYGTVTEPFASTYQGFSGAGRNNDGDVSFPESWYDTANVPPRDMAGFHFSQIGGGDRSTLPASGFTSTAGAIESVVNGDFDLGGDGEVPGWQFHDGELRADFASGRLRLVGPNLDLARHNTLYVPQDAVQVAFDYEVSAASQQNQLEIRIGGSTTPQAILDLDTSGTFRGEVPLPASAVGTGQTVELRLVPNGGFEAEVFFDNVQLEGNPNAAGDFDGNGAFDCADIDRLVAAVAAGQEDAVFDLDASGEVDANDVQRWLEIAGAVNLVSQQPYLSGDANLDGIVDGLDFIIWNANKFTATAAWCAGDFNADGVVDGINFIVWNSNKFTSASRRAGFDAEHSHLPQPATHPMTMISKPSDQPISRIALAAGDIRPWRTGQDAPAQLASSANRPEYHVPLNDAVRAGGGELRGISTGPRGAGPPLAPAHVGNAPFDVDQRASFPLPSACQLSPSSVREGCT